MGLTILGHAADAMSEMEQCTTRMWISPKHFTLMLLSGTTLL